jgi:hypothetical protein
MIRVYSTTDGRARCISFEATDPEPQPPLELVGTFEDEEHEGAWALLHELGGQPDVA